MSRVGGMVPVAQFDVYAQGFIRNLDIPCVIALQSDLLSLLRSVVVAPLKRSNVMPVFSRLTPRLEVNGEQLGLSPMELVHVPVRLLGPPIANLQDDRDRIIAALDVLFTGV